MNAVSLFSGVGGFDLALNNAGIPVVATVEIDKQARGVLEYRFPDVQHFGDITKVSGDDLRSAGFIPDTGIIVGGFPCQDVSIAGRRAGFDGERSALFYEFIRLIEETQSEWALFENVPGILSSRGGRDMGAVIGTLAELGYGVAWRVLDSQYFGVPQRRRRVFILARRSGDAASCGKILFESEGVRGNTTQVRSERQETTALTARGVGTCGADDNQAQAGHLIAFTQNQRDEVRELQGIAGALAAQPGMKQQTYIAYLDGATHTLTASYDASEDGTGRGTPLVPFVKVIRSGARDSDGNLPPEVWAERDVAPTLNQFDQSGESRTPILLTMRAGKDGGGKGALLSQDQSLTLSTGNGQTLFYEGVRRLTPIETERLQGFPDEWTKYRLENGKVVEQADSSRYKQMGNALTVPVGEWIARRMVNVAINC